MWRKVGIDNKNCVAEIWINPPDLSSDEHGGDAQQLQLRLEEEAALADKVPRDIIIFHLQASYQRIGIQVPEDWDISDIPD